MDEHFFQCPYCWQNISVLLDNSIQEQSYIEDCEVCCNPIQVSVAFNINQLVDFHADSIEQ